VRLPLAASRASRIHAVSKRRRAAASAAAPVRLAGDYSLAAARRRFETAWIRDALEAAKGNRTHAARLLGISHRALLYKLKEYGLGRS